MVDEVDETVRTAFADTYQKGYSDGYAAGIAAALEKIQSLATENSVPTPSVAPSMNISVTALGLVTKVNNALLLNGIRTIEDIYKLSEESFAVTSHLMSLRNLGYKGVVEIREKLMELGYPEIPRP